MLQIWECPKVKGLIAITDDSMLRYIRENVNSLPSFEAVFRGCDSGLYSLKDAADALFLHENIRSFVLYIYICGGVRLHTYSVFSIDVCMNIEQ